MDNGYVQHGQGLHPLPRGAQPRRGQMNTRLMKIYEDITFSDPPRTATSSAKTPTSTATPPWAPCCKYGSEGAKQFYEMFVLNPEHATAHGSGDIHIHDLDF